MPQYFYTVINKENKELNGTINAPDETSARRELNALGFSILTLAIGVASTGATEEAAESVKKFEFSAIDKNGKKIVGTIQGEAIFPVYKRLITEYQFEVQALYPSDLNDAEKEKSVLKGTDALKDQLLEEQMVLQQSQKKQQMDEQEFLDKQIKLKAQVDFVLQKVNSILETYRDELDPATKSKIKYYVEKILRIKNSTNLDYIRQSCEEMLTYLQKEEIFLNQDQRLKEKTQLAIDAKSMMMQLNRINHPGGKDIFDEMRHWRTEHITDNNTPSGTEKFIDFLISFLIGTTPEDAEITEARQKIKNTNAQIKEFVTLYFQAPDPDFKKETKNTIFRLWNQRKFQKHDLTALIHRKSEERMVGIEFTTMEVLQHEIFSLAGWVLTFYIIYYFATIYINTKQIDLFPQTRLSQIFQTSIIKYFFTTLFLFVCFLGVKIEFFRRKSAFNPILIVLFLISSSLIILNF